MRKSDIKLTIKYQPVKQDFLTHIIISYTLRIDSHICSWSLKTRQLVMTYKTNSVSTKAKCQVNSSLNKQEIHACI